VASRQRRVVWSRGAHRELEAAISHVAADAPGAARALLERLLATAASLETLSDRGRVVPEREDPAIRELRVEPYRLVYSLDTADVVILGLIHQRRDYERWRDAR
jgi:plasmid stabilization system protein ParE